MTEDNPDLLSSFNASAQQVLENVMLCPESTMKHILLRTLIAGTVLEGVHCFVVEGIGGRGGWEGQKAWTSDHQSLYRWFMRLFLPFWDCVLE